MVAHNSQIWNRLSMVAYHTQTLQKWNRLSMVAHYAQIRNRLPMVAHNRKIWNRLPMVAHYTQIRNRLSMVAHNRKIWNRLPMVAHYTQIWNRLPMVAQSEEHHPSQEQSKNGRCHGECRQEIDCYQVTFSYGYNICIFITYYSYVTRKYDYM